MRVRARSCWPTGPLRSPTPNCWHCCCAPACRGQGVLQLADHVLRAFGGFAGLLAASAGDLERVKGLGPAKRAELAAVIEIARRALAERLADAPLFDSPQALQGLSAAAARPAPARGLRGAVPRCAAPPDRDGRDVPRHADADQRLSARGRQARPRAGRRGGGIRSQPSVGRGRAVARRRVPDAGAERALALVDVRVLDHMVVGAAQAVSFAERGLL